MAEIILTIALEVAKCLAPHAYRQISYLRESKYTSNLQNLNTEVVKLKSERVNTEHQVDEAKRKGEEIEENVENWLATANSVIEEADKFTEDEATANKRCFKGLCPNLKTRPRLSKEAERQKEAVVKVLDARPVNSISYSIIPEDTLLMPNKDFEAFESRTSILNEIIDALKNPNVNMLLIYGMGGIGKTTLAKEVARKAESDKLFDQVVFSEVSESRDVRKLQGEIADKLGLKFDEESESGRARRLYDRLKKEKRILVILDNIWENLDLLDVGIPHGDDHMGCKVLFTARSEEVLSGEMESRKNFPVGFLKEDEAWSLFTKMAGDYVEDNELKEVARDVAKECAGLPVSIVTVARALRSKSIREWKDALEQLRRPSSSNFKDVQPAAFKAIELSYNKLGRDDLKNIFLLIGYTAIASIDDLLMCGMGLGLFQGVNKIEVARNRVHTLVRTLKASCMLLDHISQKKELFSMHDVVRDVAVSIASTERNVFTATNEQVDGCREWSDGSAIKHCTSIVLHGIKNNLLPEVLECPQLELLFIRADRWEFSSLTIPNNFFERMMQVRVVNLTGMFLRSLPSSLGLLSNLRTLSLCGFILPDISVVGGLKKLEILCLRGSYIKKLPVEVGELTWLKLLDLRDCCYLEVIPPNILSKLSHLEELYIDQSFRYWEMEVGGVKNASLEELKHLPNLTSLELHVYDVSTLPRGLLLEKLERYSIRIGDDEESNGSWCREFSLDLNDKICLKDSLIVQLQRIEDLELRGLQEQDVDYIRNELVKVGSSHLKRLRMRGLDPALSSAESERQQESANDLQSHEIILEDNIQISNTLFTGKVRLPELEKLHLLSINVERIWQNQVAVMSCGIQNLTRLTLSCCMNLRCLFSSSTVSSFVQLQCIEIVGCPVLEELIVMDNQEERKKNIVMFPQLQYLKMSDLEKFTSFCTGDLDILEFPSLKELRISKCPEFMVRTTSIFTERVFPNLEKLKVDAKHVVTNKYHLGDERTILSLGDFLQRLHTMKVLQIGGYSASLPYEKVENGMWVEIREAFHLEHILIRESSVTNNLVILRVKGCDHLVNLVPPSTSFQNLTNMVVSRCNNLKIVLTSLIAKTLVRLRYMKIKSCDRITEIVQGDDVVAKDEVITFRELKELKLVDLERLTSFCSGNCAFKFPSLERLVVDDCPDMKIFSEGKLSTPKLHKVERHGEACWAWKDDLNTTIQKLVSLPGMLAGVWSDDSGLQLEATTWFRKLLLPPSEKVIQSGVVARFVEFLTREDNPQLQLEAARALTNIASENTNVVIDGGAVPIFVKLLSSPSDDVREKAVWALGNIARSSPRDRDLVLSEKALIPLLAQLNKHAKPSMLRNATKTLSRFCQGKPEPPFDQVRPALPALAQLVHSNDNDVLRYACEALSCLSDGTNDKIQAVIEADVCPRLVKLLLHPLPFPFGLTPPLWTVRYIVKGDGFLTQCTGIAKEACRTISNITAGNREQIQVVIDAGVIGPLVDLLQNAEFFTKKEAARAISNAISGGTHEQIKYLVRKGCIKPLCDLLLYADPEIVTICLKGLENILKVGEAEMNTGTANRYFNHYARLVEAAEGFKKIEDLKRHDSNGICEKAVKILEIYWSCGVIGRGR
ncbi:Disease resistance protein [Citrus sinensis]|uniref:Disease resistance protein n=1 Tax=Citrus sinensis TaxID=2711 RepID=A0ACB8KID9_CITSI|nr:Disease resistance protein [Citrus sinensis]